MFNSLVRRNGLLAGKSIDSIGRVRTFPFMSEKEESSWIAPEQLDFPNIPGSGTDSDDAASSFERIRTHQQELSMTLSRMQTWVLKEKCVTV